MNAGHWDASQQGNLPFKSVNAIRAIVADLHAPGAVGAACAAMKEKDWGENRHLSQRPAYRIGHVRSKGLGLPLHAGVHSHNTAPESTKVQ